MIVVQVAGVGEGGAAGRGRRAGGGDGVGADDGDGAVRGGDEVAMLGVALVGPG